MFMDSCFIVWLHNFWQKQHLRWSFRLGKVSMSAIIASSAFGLLASSCGNYFIDKGDPDPHMELAVMLGLVQSQDQYYSELYRITREATIPSFSENTDFIHEATSSDVNPARLKLIFIHGWNFRDRNNLRYPSQSELRARALHPWSEYLRTDDLSGAASGKAAVHLIDSHNYDLFSYDYLTSQNIARNARLFRDRLDSLFGGETETVVLFGYSMGGILARKAVYLDERPGYIKEVITSASPLRGSPWASPEYRGETYFLGGIAAFLTDTPGGQDLRWENHDGSLPGASNPFLESLNQKTARDDLFYTFYSAIDNENRTRESDSAQIEVVPGVSLNLGCLAFATAFGQYSDCIVPESSQKLERLAGEPGATLPGTNSGRYDHFDMRLRPASLRAAFFDRLTQ